MCRIFARQIYRALGAEDIRHRRAASEAVLMRRLLSLDYVLEHPDLPWLPTESEKVGAFEALGIERRLLPSRLYRGAAGNTRRYFPLKLPVALEAERALFVYVEPGHDTATALRSWGEAHLSLWQALSERGRSVEVVAVVRTLEEFARARSILGGWAEASGPAEPDAGIREEIDRFDDRLPFLVDPVRLDGLSLLYGRLRRRADQHIEMRIRELDVGLIDSFQKSEKSRARALRLPSELAPLPEAREISQSRHASV